MRFYIIFFSFILLLKDPSFAQSANTGAKGPDFDGDGISDVSGFENQHDGSPNELAITWISSSTSSLNRTEYGKALQSSVPSDWDGDGITDFAIVGVNEASEYLWQFKLSTNGGAETSDVFGKKEDLVLYGCSFDSDAKSDRAVFDTVTGILTYQKSSDLSSATLNLAAGLERLICADLNGDGIDEFIGQKSVKTESKNKIKRPARKKKKKKGKKPKKQPAKSGEKAYFYIWDLSGSKTLDLQFGSGVKGIFAADTDGDGIKEFGYQRESASEVKTELVFYSAGAEKIITVPEYLDVSFNDFSNSSGVPDGFVLKAKAENIFLKFNSLNDPANYQEIYIPRADTVISTKAATTVGPVVSKETECEVDVEPHDGGEGFLWKPVSDTTGTVAVLLPSSMRLTKVRIIKNNVIIENLSYGGNGNGNRDHWRSGRRYNTFDDNVTVIGTGGGVNYCWLIPDPSKRID
jgi:hypothetical protein